jgi:hypothetical protein
MLAALNLPPMNSGPTEPSADKRLSVLQGYDEVDGEPFWSYETVRGIWLPANLTEGLVPGGAQAVVLQENEAACVFETVNPPAFIKRLIVNRGVMQQTLHDTRKQRKALGREGIEILQVGGS